MALDMARKISFKPASRRSSHVPTARDRLARHWTRDCALPEHLPKQIRFLLADMTCRVAVGYGDTPSVARHSVEEGMRDQGADGSAGQRRLLAEKAEDG